MELKDFKSYELVRELTNRKDIQFLFVPPYGNANINIQDDENPADNINLNIEGAATILIDTN